MAKNNLPTVFIGFDNRLTLKERQRVARHSLCYEDIMVHLAVHNSERETLMFLHEELLREHPRSSILNRLIGRLLRQQSGRKRAEVLEYAEALTRKGH